MVQYCRKCGAKLDDDAEICDKCGFILNDDPFKDESNDNIISNILNENAEGKRSKFVLALSVVAIILSFTEGLSTPTVVGLDNIIMGMVIGFVCGITGIILIRKLNEPFIGAVEFIVAGALIYVFIGRYGELSALLFVIAAIIEMYFKGFKTYNKKLWFLPVITIALIFVILIAGGILYHVNAESSVDVGNFSQNITNNGNGYYDGYLKGEIEITGDYEYLSANINYYDNQGKIIQNDIGWNAIHPATGTYEISSTFFNQNQPVKAEIQIIDSTDNIAPIYAENVTITS